MVAGVGRRILREAPLEFILIERSADIICLAVPDRFFLLQQLWWTDFSCRQEITNYTCTYITGAESIQETRGW